MPSIPRRLHLQVHRTDQGNRLRITVRKPVHRYSSLAFLHVSTVTINKKIAITNRKAPAMDKSIFPIAQVKQTASMRNNTRAPTNITFRKALSLGLSINFLLINYLIPPTPSESCGVDEIFRMHPSNYYLILLILFSNKLKKFSLRACFHEPILEGWVFQ